MEKEWLTNPIVESLLRWYDSGRRILPWREEPTPYHVWISEIMLQQTRVEAVKPYYDRFISELPDIGSLAQVEEERLLKLWEGLGYYNRARNLRKAAQILTEEQKGEMPETYEELLRLPGIGSYTAGAIASIAFGKRVPAVDGNVLRILARLRMDERDILNDRVKREVEKELAERMPAERPGDFNQAMMELGATVCVPNGAPRCEECPWRGCCQAQLAGRVQEFPYKSPKKARIAEKKTILLIRDADRVVIRKRPAKGLLAGMYEFPAMEGYATPEQVIDYLKEYGLSALHVQKLTDAKHIFTHREWHMRGYAVRVDELTGMGERGEKEGFLLIEPEKIEKDYPIPTAYAVYAGYLEMQCGARKSSGKDYKEERK